MEEKISWITCDVLPEAWEAVLVSLSDSVTIGYVDKKCDWFALSDSRTFERAEVIAWAKMPNPYEKK